MEISLEELYDAFDLETYDYFCHQTDSGNGENILNKGIYVKGTNIINTKNVLFTTAFPLDKSDIQSFDTFLEFLDEFRTISLFRNALEMVIIAVPKEHGQYIVERKNTKFKGEDFIGIIPTESILGYIDLVSDTFIPNENFDYCFTANIKKLLY